MQRILVTGSQGFIGRFLVSHWLAVAPDAVIVGIGRSSETPAHFTHNVHWGTETLRAPLPAWMADTRATHRYRYQPQDLIDRPALIGLLQQVRPTQIIHLAAALRDDAPAQLFGTNVLATESLIEAIAGSGIEPPMLLLGSTGGVYGAPQPGALPLTEMAHCFPIDPYSISKRAGEDLSQALARRHGIPMAIARIFNVVGPGEDERHFCGWLASQLAAIRKGLCEPVVRVGPLGTTRDFIDVRDVAVALHLIATRGQSGNLYNVASGIETSMADVFLQMLQSTGLSDQVRVDRRPARPADIPRHFADISRLIDLGFEHRISLETSLEDVARYYSETVAPSAEGATRRVPGGRRGRGARSLKQVNVQTEYNYPVEIATGLLADLPKVLRGRFGDARISILSDETVFPIYGNPLLEGLRGTGTTVDAIVIPPGEASKSLDCYSRIIGELRRQAFDRRALLVNIGGGLVSDLGGFVAASYMRGVQYVNVPTTLLAQHDASVGGKVAVNMPWAKNFVGAFHHPSGVYIDPECLSTLPARDLHAGVAESIKVAMCGEPELFHLLESRAGEIREATDSCLLQEIVERSVVQKIALLAPDPYEVELRRVLNLGHTFGHPLEVEMAYSDLLHGEAVAFGIAIATAIAEEEGICDAGFAERVYSLLHAYELPPRIDRQRLVAASRRLDEIRLLRANQLNFVLPESPGRVRIVPEIGDLAIPKAIDRIARHRLLGACVVS